MYLTLYRKYRPQSFFEVAGETEIMRTLRNSLKENRMTHAYLFSGPRGVGKTTTARLIAKGLNCITNGVTDTPCNSCKNCKAIENGTFFDLIEIDAASNRGIDEIRNLKERVNYKPVEGRKKVYIIDEVHMLTKEAFNALLKTLEEPPEFVMFILATTEPERIIDTILSRCQRYDFMPLTLDEISKKIKEIAEKEKIKIDDKSIEIIYEKSGGSMRDAISIFEKLISYNYGEIITFEKSEKALGIISEHKIIEFNKLINEKEGVEHLFKFIDNLWNDGINVEDFLKEYCNYLKKKIILEKTDLEKNSKIIEIVFDVLFKFKYEEDKRMVGYLAAIKILKGNNENIPNVIYEQKKEVREEETSSSAVIKKEAQFFINNWKSILNSAKERKISLYAFLSMARPVAIEKNRLIIEFPHENSFHKTSMEKAENLNLFREVLREVSGDPIDVKFEIAGERKQKSDGSGLVKSVVDFFEGEIIK